MTETLSPPAEWEAPPRAYLIVAPARSGSTLLAHILRKAGMFGVPDEYFNRAWLRGVLKGPLPSAAECFRYAGEKGRGPDGSFGMKLIASQLRYLDETCAIEDWLPERRWIRLRRRDLLGQAISHAIANQTGLWSSMQKGGREPAYDRDMILRSLIVGLEEDAYLAIYFALHREKVVDLMYEDFENDHQRALDAITAHFGLPRVEAAPQAAMPVKRQRDDRNEEWRERFLAEMRDRGDMRGLGLALGLVRPEEGAVDVRDVPVAADGAPALAAVLAGLVGLDRRRREAYAAGRKAGAREAAAAIITEIKSTGLAQLADDLTRRFQR